MGLFNDIFSTVAPTLIETFVNSPRAFRRRTVIYDPSLGSEVPTDFNATFLTGPPTPFVKTELDFRGGSFGYKKGDTTMVVATAHYQAENFDIEPTSDAQVFALVDGEEHMVLEINPFDAGDGNVAVKLHLRR